jgi:hypothetical protein
MKLKYILGKAPLPFVVLHHKTQVNCKSEETQHLKFSLVYSSGPVLIMERNPAWSLPIK